MSNAHTIKNVRLISRTDRAYILWARNMAYQSNVNRAERTPDTRQLLSNWLESVVRSELSKNFNALETNIITWEERTSRGFAKRHYKEVDCLISLDSKTIICVEIKSSLSKSSIKGGRSQLSRSNELLRKIYPNIISLLVLGDCSDIEPTLGKLEGEELPTHLGSYVNFSEFSGFTEESKHYFWIISSSTLDNYSEKYPLPEKDSFDHHPD
jgi:hypothetical protein